MQEFRCWRLTTGVLFLGVASLAGSLEVVEANEGKATLAAPIVVQGVVRDGDIISYNASEQQYVAAQRASDAAMYGVVVDDPLLYMWDQDAASGTRPVVRYGEAFVNVSDVAGTVRAGDLVTTSHIVGVGQRADRDVSGYVLGFAVGDVEYDSSVEPLQLEGEEVRFGVVPVALQMGYYNADEGVVEEEPEAVPPAIIEEDGNGGFDVFLLFRYLLGSFVALTAVVLALRRFGDLFAQSIVSVGRNPLARSQIRSILVWNAVLIVIVSGVGLGIGVAIIVM